MKHADKQSPRRRALAACAAPAQEGGLDTAAPHLAGLLALVALISPAAATAADTFPDAYLDSAARQAIRRGLAETMAGLDGFSLLCGRYEGVDQRFLDHWVDHEISLGDFVITGGTGSFEDAEGEFVAEPDVVRSRRL